MRISFPAIAIGLLLAAGCCQPEPVKDYGLFQLQSKNKTALKFALNAPLLTFTGGASGVGTYTYSQPAFFEVSGGALNCRDKGRCGVFCDNYSEEAGATTFQTGNGQQLVQFRLAKNFLKHSATEPADSISDMLSVAAPGISPINLPLDKLPAASVVMLNGKTYNDVYALGSAPIPPFDTENTAVAVYYFTLATGVVGWVEYSGRAWNLQ